mmetsp:Transcript_2725/g.3825  ORF Transcript_2725/g.3825 Transcript_2725/m.3825 type:complete len:92 (+) Transcript_2725:1106-1381(+)
MSGYCGFSELCALYNLGVDVALLALPEMASCGSTNEHHANWRHWNGNHLRQNQNVVVLKIGAKTGITTVGTFAGAIILVELIRLYCLPACQ